MGDSSPAGQSYSGRIVRNTLWNLVGQVVPLLVAVIAIPLLIKGLGVERFGVLTLAWMVIGYFSLFDLGLGRALIKLVSQKLGADQTEEIPELIWTALLLMLFLGLLGGGVVLALTNWLVTSVLNIEVELQRETANTFWLLALSVPVVILTTGLRGILEAYQRFDLVNIVRVPMGVLTFAGPLAVLPFTKQLDVVVLVLLGLRTFIGIAHVLMCERIVPGLFRHACFSRSHVRLMLGFGGWMTVTNVVGPMMIYLDRFVIGSVLSMSAVAYYVTPYEVIIKLLVIPGALVGVLFPAFAASLAGNRFRAVNLFDSGVRWVFLAVFPAALVATVYASDGLQLWLSREFSQNSSPILQWLAAGVLLNSLASIPFAFIQAAGRPDLTAKLHLAELPVYLLGLWVALNQWGLVGAAIAWTFRAGFDALAMFVVSSLLEDNLRQTLKRDALTLALALAVLSLGHLATNTVERTVFTSIALIGFVLLAWLHLISRDEKALIRRKLLGICGPNLP